MVSKLLKAQSTSQSFLYPQCLAHYLALSRYLTKGLLTCISSIGKLFSTFFFFPSKSYWGERGCELQSHLSPLLSTLFFLKPALWYHTVCVIFKYPSKATQGSFQLYTFRERNISSSERGIKEISINSRHSGMPLPLFTHSTNIWAVPTKSTAVLTTVRNPAPFLGLQKKKIRKRKKEGVWGVGNIRRLGKTVRTNLTGPEKWLFGLSVHLQTKNDSMTGVTFSLSQRPKYICFCPGAKSYCTFDPLTELMQGVHGAGLTQLDLGLGTLQSSGCAESLLQSQHYLIHLQGETEHRPLKVCFHAHTLKARQQWETLRMLTK